MSSSLRRGVAAAVFASSTALLATACGAGHDAATNGVRPVNAASQVDDIKVQNVNVVLPEDGDGLAGITARLFNDGTEEQVLDSVVLPDGGEVELTPPEGEEAIVLPPRGSVALGGEGNAGAVIPDAEAAEILLGNAQQVVFHLSDSGAIDVHARVVPTSGGYAHYADWAPEPAPEEPGEDEAEAGEVPGNDEGAPGQDGPELEEPGFEEPGEGEPGFEEPGLEGDAGDGTDAGGEAAEDPADATPQG